MELTNSQRAILILFNEAKIRKQEAVALLTLLNQQEIDFIIDKVLELNRLPTEQELMNILFPILKAKKTED
ncbi:MAG: hypothetical protein IJJ78_00305 [Paludibacteraceae bacterium]|nr:hypothetical protein [Paludibacteraceae bacterium]MBQ7747458.1 hypothetical protein [Paludibacteraceae bacterium]MBR0497506.1 hypothetical protein [Paludibacteraceae bacterium]